jgi:1-acylglycerone phosphate reductase
LLPHSGRNYTVPALDIDMSEVKTTFATNVFAIMEITQHFIPLLITSKGLIINIGSVAGIMPYVFGSVYNASKAAIHSYSATLRLELEPYDVKVMVVVTGGVQSNIARTYRSLPEGSLYLPIRDSYERRLTHSQEGAMSNEEYARGVVSAALKSRPKKWLWRGNKSWSIWFVKTFLGLWVLDLVLPRVFQLDKLKAIIKSRDKSR